MSYVTDSAQYSLSKLVDARLDELAMQAIEHFRSVNEGTHPSGEDSGLKDAWEEYAFQEQYIHSVLSGIYVEDLEGWCLHVAEELSAFENQLLWYWTRECQDWDEDDNPEPPYCIEDVAKELFYRVNAIAVNWPLDYEEPHPD